MKDSLFRKGSKSFYESPLAEEIVVSFEENILSGQAQLGGMRSGDVGASGYNGDAFQGTTYDNL